MGVLTRSCVDLLSTSKLIAASRVRDPDLDKRVLPHSIYMLFLSANVHVQNEVQCENSVVRVDENHLTENLTI